MTFALWQFLESLLDLKNSFLDDALLPLLFKNTVTPQHKFLV